MKRLFFVPLFAMLAACGGTLKQQEDHTTRSEKSGDLYTSRLCENAALQMRCGSGPTPVIDFDIDAISYPGGDLKAAQDSVTVEVTLEVPEQPESVSIVFQKDGTYRESCITSDITPEGSKFKAECSAQIPDLAPVGLRNVIVSVGAGGKTYRDYVDHGFTVGLDSNACNDVLLDGRKVHCPQGFAGTLTQTDVDGVPTGDVLLLQYQSAHISEEIVFSREMTIMGNINNGGALGTTIYGLVNQDESVFKIESAANVELAAMNFMGMPAQAQSIYVDVVNASQVALSHLEFEYVEVFGIGAAVSIVDSSDVRIQSAKFIGSVSDTAGGAARILRSDDVTIRNSTFSNNSTSNDGGAIWASSSERLRIEYSAFENNFAGNVGGAMYLEGVDADVRFNRFVSNSTNTFGGHLMLVAKYQDSDLNIQHNNFIQDTGNQPNEFFTLDEVGRTFSGRISDNILHRAPGAPGMGAFGCLDGPSASQPVIGNNLRSGSGATSCASDGTDYFGNPAFQTCGAGSECKPYTVLESASDAAYMATGEVDGTVHVGCWQGFVNANALAPRNLAALLSPAHQIFLSWQAPQEPNYIVDYYKVHRDDQVLTIVQSPFFLDFTAQPGVQYSYYVTSVNPAGVESAPTNTQTVFNDINAPDFTAPTSPENLSGEVSVLGDTVNLSWDVSSDNIGVSGYRIYRDEGAGFEWVATTLNLNFTDDSDNAPAQPDGIRYKVIARDFAGNDSAPSNVITVYPY